jgi:hypothetical protein
MNTAKQTYREFYIEKHFDFIGLLCQMDKYFDFDITFTWSQDNGMDVCLTKKTTNASEARSFKKLIETATQELNIWEGFVRNTEREAQELFGKQDTSMLDAKLGSAYIYMQAAKNLSKKKIRKLMFKGMELRDGQLHYLFSAGDKEIDVLFVGKVMDNFLTRIARETKQNQENKFNAVIN